MTVFRIRPLAALALSLVAHAALVALWVVAPRLPEPALIPEPLHVIVTPPPAAAQPERIEAAAKTRPQPVLPTPTEAAAPTPVAVPTPPASEKTPATMAAPPAPTAEEWALAATYTLKNSKRYRYNWGQQVRSMMGTAIEGVRDGLVRFRIEIAPDGKLVKADVLWSTSEIAEKLALEAIRVMPPLPPTPTGKPLIFEKTISFMPFETGWPPIYKYDCLPDPPTFSNRFAWDGTSPRRAAPVSQESTAARETPPTECPDAPEDSIEAEEKDMERQFKEWGAVRLNGAD